MSGAVCRCVRLSAAPPAPRPPAAPRLSAPAPSFPAACFPWVPDRQHLLFGALTVISLGSRWCPQRRKFFHMLPVAKATTSAGSKTLISLLPLASVFLVRFSPAVTSSDHRRKKTDDLCLALRVILEQESAGERQLLTPPPPRLLTPRGPPPPRSLLSQRRCPCSPRGTPQPAFWV